MKGLKKNDILLEIQVSKLKTKTNKNTPRLNFSNFGIYYKMHVG